MAIPDYGTAVAQLPLDLQVVQEDIDLSQNMDSVLESQFTMLSSTDASLQQYRHGIQFSTGGHSSAWQPDGGSLPKGIGPGYGQFIIAPIPVITGFNATQLMKWIGEGGKDVTVDDPIARMVKDAKVKHAHSRDTYMQGYNTGVVGTVDTSYVAGNIVNMQNVSFGARLMDANEKYSVTDANLNIVDTVYVSDKFSTSIGAGDTITIDHVPVGLAPGYNFTPTGLTSGTPLWLQGLEYIVDPSNTGDYDSVDRSLSWVQSPALNATNGTLTLGTVSIFKARQQQALGTRNWMSGGDDAFWYTHIAQATTAETLGFAKSTYFLSGSSTPSYDIGPRPTDEWMISGRKVMTETTAGIDKLYSLRKSLLRGVRYPGSQKFLTWPGGSTLWWPRMDNMGNWLTEYDMYYQDSTNYYTKLPWGNGVITTLGINPAFADAV